MGSCHGITYMFSKLNVTLSDFHQGEEWAAKGGNVQFGPAVNVARVANGGRSFEYLSGEVKTMFLV